MPNTDSNKLSSQLSTIIFTKQQEKSRSNIFVKAHGDQLEIFLDTTDAWERAQACAHAHTCKHAYMQLILSVALLLMWFWVIIVITAVDQESWKFSLYLWKCPQSSCLENSDMHTRPHPHSTYPQLHTWSLKDEKKKQPTVNFKGFWNFGSLPFHLIHGALTLSTGWTAVFLKQPFYFMSQIHMQSHTPVDKRSCHGIWFLTVGSNNFKFVQ